MPGTDYFGLPGTTYHRDWKLVYDRLGLPAMNEKTALLVIDMQLCAFDGKLMPPIHKGRELVNEVASLITTARQSNIPVIYIQHCAPLEGKPYAKGTHGWEIHPSIAPEPGEAVVYKSQSSGFVGTELQSVLAQKGIKTVVTCGIQSEYCLSNTSISALELGLDVVVLENAHGTVSTEEDEAPVIIDRQNALLSERGAKIQTCSSFIGLLAAR